MVESESLSGIIDGCGSNMVIVIEIGCYLCVIGYIFFVKYVINVDL